MIRHSSRRFTSRYDHSYPEHADRTPRVSRRIRLVGPGPVREPVASARPVARSGWPA